MTSLATRTTRSSRCSGSRPTSRRWSWSTPTRESSRTRPCAPRCSRRSTNSRSSPRSTAQTRHGLDPVLPDRRAARTAWRWTHPKYDPTLLAKAVSGLSNKKVDLAYSSDDARNQRDAELVQTELQSAGLERHRTRHPDRPGLRPAQPHGPGSRPAALHGQPGCLPSRHLGPDLHEHRRGASTGCSARCPRPTRRWTRAPRHDTPPTARPTTPRRRTCRWPTAASTPSPTSRRWSSPPAGYSGWCHQPPALFTVRFGDLKTSGS